MKFNFWNALSLWAARRAHEAWMYDQGYDQKCPVCRTWYSASGTWDNPITATEDCMEDDHECAKCGTVTTWRHDSMIGYSVNAKLNSKANLTRWNQKP